MSTYLTPSDMVNWLRILGVGLSAAGAIFLAWRVKGILDAMVMAHSAADINFRLIIDVLNGQPGKAPLVVGMDQQVSNKQKAGIRLLVAGFACLAIGNILVGVSWYLDS